LSEDSSLSAFPSDLTLGARVFPLLKGLSATAAVDIGTSGTSNFIEELAPTLPWDVWLGIGYAFDIQEPAPREIVRVERVVEASPLKPELRARGFVRERGKEAGIADAILRYQGRELTAMATANDGRFVSQPLQPGAYTFNIEADGYKSGECAVVIPSEPPAASATGTTTTAGTVAAPTTAVAPTAPTAPQPVYFDVDCELEALPRAGTVSGVVLDSDSASPIAGATVVLSDPLGRSLQLVTDASGAFRFERVLPGAITLKAEAPSYLFRTQAVQLAQRQEAHAEVSLRKRPKLAHVSVGTNEIRINQQVHFEQDSAVILPDSQALLEEIADALASTPRITKVEIQGHTDNNGAPEHNKALSEARANAVLDWLVAHGIDSGRLIARGYGQERPMSPNVTPQARARNRRVQFMILDKAPATP
jgi:outer membrane protein OmpA-like peptidoglycan-associated protein